MRCWKFILPLTAMAGSCAAAGAAEPAPAQTSAAADKVGAGGLDLDARVPAIRRWQLWRLMWARPRAVMFDTRDPEEFEISHLPGAHRVAMDADKDAFAASIAAWSRRRTVVFYCTTSMRSQIFADAVLHPLTESGASRVVYLEGGIVAWRDAGLPLVSRRGPTRRIASPISGAAQRSGPH